MLMSHMTVRVGCTVVLFVAASWLVPTADGQLFQNNGGNNRGNQGGGWGGNNNNRPGSNRPQFNGNWFENQTTPGYYEGGEIWVPGQTTVQPNVGNILNDVINGIGAGIQNGSQPPRPPRPPQYPNRPPQYPNNVVYPAPRPRPPAAAPAPVAKQNTVVKKIEPAKNSFDLRGYGLNATAETDAQQVIAASEMEGRAQIATTTDVADAVKNGANPAMQNAWTDYVNDPSPEKLQQFKDDWGAELEAHQGPAATAGLDVQIEIGNYKQGLLDGQFTSAGKDKAIARIQDKINGITNPDTRDALLGKADELQDLNNLGKLAEATQNNPNGVVILLDGATSAGFPPSLVSDMVGMPIMEVSPVTDKVAKQITEGAFVFNPAENAGPIHYLIGRSEYSMEPGYNQTCSSGSVISFNNGKDTTKKYTLSNASYKFVVVDDVWDLKLSKFKVTIDNSDYPADFHFVFENKQEVLHAGEIRTIESAYPIVLTFDRGDGKEPAVKRLLTGNFKVGLDASQTRIDLFDEEVIAAGPTSDELYASGGTSRDSMAAKRAKALQERLRAKNLEASAQSDVDQLLESLKSGN